jgi:hypothetical protein
MTKWKYLRAWKRNLAGSQVELAESLEGEPGGHVKVGTWRAYKRSLMATRKYLESLEEELSCLLIFPRARQQVKWAR